MKKMIASLLASLLFAPVLALAQNIPTTYNAGGVGVPNYTLQSGGSFYGQLNNSGSASLWNLGFGSSQSTSGTAVLNWDSAGHIRLGGIGVPVVSSCGTSPSGAAGSDNAGDVSMGTVAATTCTLTFAAPYANVPHCFASNRTSKLSTVSQATTTTLVIVGTGAGAFANALDVIDYVCIGH